MGTPRHSRFWSGLGEIIKRFWLFFFLVGAVLLAILASKTDTSLGRAAANGDLVEVQKLVEGGADINQANPINGDTPLELALIYANGANNHGDNFSVAQYLLDKGAKVTADALELAILNSRLDLVKEIVSRGEKPKPDSLAHYISSVVELSNINFDQQLADYLLDSGANINVLHEDVYKDKFTALGFAVHYRNINIVKYLVERGADVNVPMANGKTPLNVAEEEYKVYEDDPTGPGIHYYRVVSTSPEIANLLRQYGAR